MDGNKGIFVQRPEYAVHCIFWWCPSIAWMKYAQCAHARGQLLMHGIRPTSGLRYGMRHPPLASGDGVRRCVRRRAEIPSRDAGSGSREFDSRSLSAVRVLDRPRSGSPARLPWQEG